ncbi:MAG TPA: Spy/CpxP family protein refolding chaperone [Candidatus Limnocylindrales bacterium]|nr:Spy/CpxP family protein refolding chaperone [Candidatus Limnocylindrales bacterium]
MKTNKWITLTVATALNIFGLMTTPSLAADANAPAHGRFFQRIAERLNLTDDQKAQIKTILRSEKDTLKPLVSSLHAARKNLRAAIRAGDANETTVRAASARVAAVEADLAVERMKIFAKIAPILTDEQRQQISEFEQHADDFTDRAIARASDRLGD